MRRSSSILILSPMRFIWMAEKAKLIDMGIKMYIVGIPAGQTVRDGGTVLMSLLIVINNKK